ncbi:hypothetical protein M3J09_002845 [Ascochyta lentis]
MSTRGKSLWTSNLQCRNAQTPHHRHFMCSRIGTSIRCDAFLSPHLEVVKSALSS